MPIHNCREFLEFPPVIHTGQGDSPNELLYFTLAQYQLKIMCSFLSTIDCQENNFHAQILESCFLKQSILNTEPLDGQYDELEYYVSRHHISITRLASITKPTRAS